MNTAAYRLVPVANRVNFERMRLTAGVSSLAPVVALLPGLPVYDSRLFGALRDSYSGSGRRSGQVKKLYIGNLPFSATEDQLNEWVLANRCNTFSVNLIRGSFYGAVARVFAFVEVNSDEDADRAVNSLNGQNFGGRNLVGETKRAACRTCRWRWWTRWRAAGIWRWSRWRWRRTRWPRWWRRTWAAIAETEAAIAVIVGKRALSGSKAAFLPKAAKPSLKKF